MDVTVSHAVELYFFLLWHFSIAIYFHSYLSHNMYQTWYEKLKQKLVYIVPLRVCLKKKTLECLLQVVEMKIDS